MNQIELKIEHTFTGEELTELERITRTHREELYKKNKTARGDEAREVLARDKLLKGIHLKVQSMCVMVNHPPR